MRFKKLNSYAPGINTHDGYQMNNALKKQFARALGLFGALLSLASGLSWYVSATNQLAAGPQATMVSSTVDKLVYLANHTNLWAAVLATLAGIAVGIAIAIDP